MSELSLVYNDKTIKLPATDKNKIIVLSNYYNNDFGNRIGYIVYDNEENKWNSDVTSIEIPSNILTILPYVNNPLFTEYSSTIDNLEERTKVPKNLIINAYIPENTDYYMYDGEKYVKVDQDESLEFIDNMWTTCPATKIDGHALPSSTSYVKVDDNGSNVYYICNSFIWDKKKEVDYECKNDDYNKKLWLGNNLDVMYGSSNESDIRVCYNKKWYNTVEDILKDLETTIESTGPQSWHLWVGIICGVVGLICIILCFAHSWWWGIGILLLIPAVWLLILYYTTEEVDVKTEAKKTFFKDYYDLMNKLEEEEKQNGPTGAGAMSVEKKMDMLILGLSNLYLIKQVEKNFTEAEIAQLKKEFDNAK